MTSTSDEPMLNDPPHVAVASSRPAAASGAGPRRTDLALTVITAVAVAAGLVLRFYPRSGLWLDEALTANISQLPLGEIGDALRRDGHPPLFYVLLHLWASVTGGTDWWLRALPGVISTITLPVSYLVGRRLGERSDREVGADEPSGTSDARLLGAHRTGLITLAITAVLPFGIRYAGEVRMYSLVMLLVGVGYLLVDDLLGARRSVVGGTVPTAIATALVAGALLWTHYWAMWLLAAVGLLAAWRAWRDPDADRRKGARALIVALVGGGLMFLPWVPNLLYQTEHTGTPWGEQFGPASVAVITVIDFAGARFGIAQLLSYLLVFLVVLAAIGVLTPAREILLGGSISTRVRNEALVLALAMAIGWGMTYASGGTFASRYASVVYPLFVVCVAAGIAVLRGRRVALAVLAAVVLGSVWGSASTVTFERSQTDEIVERIGADIRENDVQAPVVIACPDQLGVATQRQIDRLLPERLTVTPYPTAGDPRFVDWVDYGERNEASDPAKFVEGLGGDLSGRTVYLVSSFTYRTFEGKCEQVLNLLAQGRQVSHLVEMDTDHHDEVANLWVFRPST